MHSDTRITMLGGWCVGLALLGVAAATGESTIGTTAVGIIGAAWGIGLWFEQVLPSQQ